MHDEYIFSISNNYFRKCALFVLSFIYCAEN